MINRLVAWSVRALLSLRYRVQVRGLEAVARDGKQGILFLPNHPALIDPVILLSRLTDRFAPRPLADDRQVDRFLIRYLADRMRTIRIPDVAAERTVVRAGVEAAVDGCIDALRGGDNVLLYPSGHVYRSRFEDLRGNTAVARILEALPTVRIVLVRTRGLWGSAFSYAQGEPPNVANVLRKSLRRLLANGLFFMPRRSVTVELEEPGNLPRTRDRETLNQAIEDFYNQDAEPNTYVPYTWRERGGIQHLPDPDFGVRRDRIEAVPAGARRIVIEYLRDLTGATRIEPEQHLARDLGLDSLARTELLVWLETEFGFAQPDVDALATVADVLLAACGQLASGAMEELKPVPAAWFRRRYSERAAIPQTERITDAFLAQARRTPGRAIAADPIRGVLTYRNIVTGLMVLSPRIAALPGRTIGIMLPASCGADVVYLACLFAGKVPVMINWTAGPRNIRHAVEAAKIQRILTANALIERLTGTGTDLSGVNEFFEPLETMAASISLPTKLTALVRAHLSWARLRRAPVADEAVVLLTSGSESLPKLVPLTHANILSNCRAVLGFASLYQNDCLLGMLPPFHSFGLTVGLILPLCAGISVLHYPDPTQGAMLARLIEAYKVTLMVGTPTFLAGILRAGSNRGLSTLRLAVTGAEKCPNHVYDALEKLCPNAVVLEGYGITECSPVVSANDPAGPKRGTIGKVLPGLEYAVVDPDTLSARVTVGKRGMLLVRGPSIFGGYMAYSGESPFVKFEDKTWYKTGDLVQEDPDGVLTFAGRLKRFIKLGGEMISLPAIEAAIEAGVDLGDAEGPAIAVVPTPDEEHPELILFTTLDLDRETVNQTLRAAGLSGLHNIREVRPVEEIPVLGTGKTNYRQLAEELRD